MDDLRKGPRTEFRERAKNVGAAPAPGVPGGSRGALGVPLKCPPGSVRPGRSGDASRLPGVRPRASVPGAWAPGSGGEVRSWPVRFGGGGQHVYGRGPGPWPRAPAPCPVPGHRSPWPGPGARGLAGPGGPGSSGPVDMLAQTPQLPPILQTKTVCAGWPIIISGWTCRPGWPWRGIMGCVTPTVGICGS